jgi:hypothetical protein
VRVPSTLCYSDQMQFIGRGWVWRVAMLCGTAVWSGCAPSAPPPPETATVPQPPAEAGSTPTPASPAPVADAAPAPAAPAPAATPEQKCIIKNFTSGSIKLVDTAVDREIAVLATNDEHAMGGHFRATNDKGGSVDGFCPAGINVSIMSTSKGLRALMPDGSPAVEGGAPAPNDPTDGH